MIVIVTVTEAIQGWFHAYSRGGVTETIDDTDGCHFGPSPARD
jgi:hypothetical protein